MTSDEFQERDLIEAFFHLARGQCECCGKRLSWENRGREAALGAWEAHHVEGWDDPVVLCTGEPENCHLNCGHLGDFSNPGVFPDGHHSGGTKTDEIKN